MAHTYVHNVNAYVEQATGYKADSVKVDLDEVAFRVQVYPVDTAGVKIAGASNLVDKTLADLRTAVAFYHEMTHQLSQGDVLRNV